MRPIEWRNHVEDWGRSGLTKRAYAREHNLSYTQLLYWTKKFRLAESSSELLMPVKVISSSPERQTLRLGVVEFPNGTRLHIHDTALLEELVPLLSSG